MITFEQIQKANDGLKAIDVKGKRYVMVNEKVKAFRMLYPEGFIHTEIISLQDGVVVTQTKVGYFDENGNEKVLGTGLAFERQDSSFINRSSYIENSETSSTGRALSFLYLGADDSIASAEELANAINNQNKTEKPMETPTTIFIRKMIRDTQERLGLASYEEARAKVFEMVNALVKSGTIKPVDWNKITLAEAEVIFEAIEYNFRPGEKK